MKTKAIRLASLALCILAACTTTDDAPKTYISKVEPLHDYAYDYYVDSTGTVTLTNDAAGNLTVIVPEILPPPQIVKTDSVVKSVFTQMVEYITKENTNVFTVDVTKANEFLCSKGTKITVPADAFVYADGSEVKDPVHLSVGEFLSKADFIMAGLTSTSDGKMIESSGMYNLSGMANGKEVNLKQGKKITITVPNTIKVFSETQMFMGNSDTITQAPTNWTATNLFSDYAMELQRRTDNADMLASKNIIRLTTIGKKFKPSDKEYLPDLQLFVTNPPYAEKMFYDTRYKETAFFNFLKEPFIKKKMYEAVLTMDDWDTLKIVATIDKSGRIADIKASAKSLTPDNADAIEKALYPKRMVKMIKKRHTETTDYNIYGVKVGAITPDSSFSTMAFRIGSLGWGNCDQYIDNPNIITMKLDKPIEGDQKYYCVFKRFNSVLPAYSIDGVAAFSAVPKNEDVVIVGIENKNGVAGLLIQECKSNYTVKTGYFIPMPFDKAKETLQKYLGPGNVSQEVSQK